MRALPRSDDEDVYARFIASWRVSLSMCADFVLGALEQALYASARAKRLADAPLEPHAPIRFPALQRAPVRSGHRVSVGSKEDSYDSALTEPITGESPAQLTQASRASHANVHPAANRVEARALCFRAEPASRPSDEGALGHHLQKMDPK